jgi:endonuclease-3
VKSLKQRADKIRKILRSAYPDVKTQLTHANPFELLVATILSAQCTDRQVNQVTGPLFQRFPTPEALAHGPIDEVERLIHSTGFYKNKAKNIRNCAKSLLERHGGTVPAVLEDLVKLPGVGRKTANVVLGAAFGIPGVVVDTHVARISQRLGFTASTDPVKIEHDLMELVPRRAWNDFGLHLIYFGRDICSARKPACPRCPVRRHCPYPDKTTG